MKATFNPYPSCFERKREKKRWEDELQKIHIAADVHASWKKV